MKATQPNSCNGFSKPSSSSMTTCHSLAQVPGELLLLSSDLHWLSQRIILWQRPKLINMCQQHIHLKVTPTWESIQSDWVQVDFLISDHRSFQLLLSRWFLLGGSPHPTLLCPALPCSASLRQEPPASLPALLKHPPPSSYILCQPNLHTLPTCLPAQLKHSLLTYLYFSAITLPRECPLFQMLRMRKASVSAEWKSKEFKSKLVIVSSLLFCKYRQESEDCRKWN